MCASRVVFNDLLLLSKLMIHCFEVLVRVGAYMMTSVSQLVPVAVFQRGDVKFLICTDVAARGIDVSGLPFGMTSHVVHLGCMK